MDVQAGQAGGVVWMPLRAKRGAGQVVGLCRTGRQQHSVPSTCIAFKAPAPCPGEGKPTQRAGPACPAQHAAQRPRTCTVSVHSPLFGFHTRSDASPSPPPVTTALPSGENPPQVTAPLCPENTCSRGARGASAAPVRKEASCTAALLPIETPLKVS